MEDISLNLLSFHVLLHMPLYEIYVLCVVPKIHTLRPDK